MSRKILLSVAAIFAFNFGGFAQENATEEDAVMILEENNETKTVEGAEASKDEAVEAQATEAEKPAEAIAEKAEEKVVEEVETGMKEEAVNESVEKADEKIEKIASEDNEKQKAIEKSTQKIEETKKEDTKNDKSTFSWFNPMNWFASDKNAEKQEQKEEAKADDAAATPVETIQEAQVEPIPATAAQDEKKESSSSIARTAILWLPNILINLTDIISLDGGVGSESALEVDITKYFGLGGALGEKYFIQKGYDRQLGGGYSSGWDFQFICFNTEKRYVEDTFGSSRQYYIGRKYFELADPENHTYVDKKRDFYAISVKAGWLAVIGLEIHPVEIADFVASIFFLDIRGDNLK